MVTHSLSLSFSLSLSLYLSVSVSLSLSLSHPTLSICCRDAVQSSEAVSGAQLSEELSGCLGECTTIAMGTGDGR